MNAAVISDERLACWRWARHGSVRHHRCLRHANCPDVVVPSGKQHNRGAGPTGGCP